jgi:predicted SAM-dependent methyltransferase
MSRLLSPLIHLFPRSWRDRYRYSFYNAWQTAPKFFEWKLRRWSGKITYPNNPEGLVMVHLGCGDIADPRYINVDKRPAPHVHHLGGVDSLPYLGANFADFIYTSHCLEHIPYDQVPKVLAEWARVLKPGGRLRIAVPDFDGIVNAYQRSGQNLALVQPTLLGGQNYPLNFHFSAYTKPHLTGLLEAAGFVGIKAWHHGEDDLTNFPDCSTATIPAGGTRVPVSLNLEGTKAE